MMREITFREALREAMQQEMRSDQTVFIIGEDTGRNGGTFKVLDGMIDEFGPERIIETPLAESGFVGAAVGAAVMGMKPIAEVMFLDFLTVAMDQIVNNAAKMSYMYDGVVSCPIVVRGNCGAGTRVGVNHSQSFEAWFCHVPGVKVAYPSNPADAKGLMTAAIRDPNPVIFFEHKALYNTKGMVPEGEYVVPLGKADVKREGTDVSVIATGVMVGRALNAAKKLEAEGVSVEVVDPRTLQPMDEETLAESACKTGRVVIAQESAEPCSVGSEIAAMLGRRAFGYLDMPIEMVSLPFTPNPFSPALEDFIIPREEQIIVAVRRVLGLAEPAGVQVSAPSYQQSPAGPR